jgi:hypothetical protein
MVLKKNDSPLLRQLKQKKELLLVSFLRIFLERKLFLTLKRKLACRARWKKFVALNWCKPENFVDELEVSWRLVRVFHKLFNTCVENLISQKYFSPHSAFVLLSVVILRF